MVIEKIMNGNECTLKLTGRLDTTTAPALTDDLNKIEATAIVFDLSDLEYVSSAGLRVFLSTHKKMNGNMIIRHPQSMIMDVLEITGFLDILKIEE